MKYFCLHRVFWVSALLFISQLGLGQVPAPPPAQPSAKDNPICTNDTTVTTAAGQQGAIVSYAIPKLMLNGTPYDMKLVQGIASGSTFPLGITPVVYEGKDDTGGLHYCRFDVTIIKEAPPVIKTPQLPTVLNPKHNLGADTITYEPMGITLNTCEVTLYGFDGRDYDRDTVSIIFNDEVLVNRVEIVRNTKNYKGLIKLKLNLVPGMPNTLILKAWNEGTVKPNTLTVEIFETHKVKRSQLKEMKPIVLDLNAKPGHAKGIVLNCD